MAEINSAEPQVEVRYWLVDHTGGMFAGAHADRLFVAPAATVSDLRHRIKEANAVKLHQLDANNLLMYVKANGGDITRDSAESLLLGSFDTVEELRAATAGPASRGGRTLTICLWAVVPAQYSAAHAAEEQSARPEKRKAAELDQYQTIDVSLLHSPIAIPAPAITEARPPPFTGPDGWRERIFNEICARMAETDTSGTFVPPMAFMRCSRGGKTRALLEIGQLLKQQLPNVAIIYISFNNFSSLHPGELADPQAALRRRIAFAARKDLAATFSEFVESDFSRESLLPWLGSTPCVLLVDELNLLTSIDRATALFLKETFLMLENRYFVFSSHIVSAVQTLSAFMDTESNRGLLAFKLPEAPSLESVRVNFEWSDVSRRQFLYCAGIPGLLLEVRSRKSNLKRSGAIDACLQQRLLNDHTMKLLLASFINGEHRWIPKPLLVCMDSFLVAGKLEVRWIPFHMVEAIGAFAECDECSEEIRKLLTKMFRLFQTFEGAKPSSGDGWESLFVLVVIIRCISEEFDKCFLPFEKSFFSVSFNPPLIDDQDLTKVTSIAAFIPMIPESMPGDRDHLAIFYPPHAQFEMYDVIVVHYSKAGGSRHIYGYQLKAGKAKPNTAPLECFKKSILLHGDFETAPAAYNGWYVASEAEINIFFGKSGRNWTPKIWKALE